MFWEVEMPESFFLCNLGGFVLNIGVHLLLEAVYNCVIDVSVRFFLAKMTCNLITYRIYIIFDQYRLSVRNNRPPFEFISIQAL